MPGAWFLDSKASGILSNCAARGPHSACSLPVLVRAGTLCVPALVSSRKAVRASTQAGVKQVLCRGMHL